MLQNSHSPSQLPPDSQPSAQFLPSQLPSLPVPALPTQSQRPAPPKSYPARGVPGEYRYHRLLTMNPRNYWAITLLLGVFAGIGFFAVSVVYVAVTAVIDFDYIQKAMQLTVAATPADQAWMFGSVAVVAPMLLLVQIMMRMRPLGFLFSVAGRLRVRWLLVCFTLALVLMLLVFEGSEWIPFLAASDSASAGDPGYLSWVSRDWVWFVLTVVLIIPIQCTAEELLFRGVVLQVVGSWLRNPIWAILISTILFSAGHLYGAWAFADVVVMGLAMGYLAWRTGGLEAGIGLHIANNDVVSISSMFSGVEMDMGTDGDWKSFLVSTVFICLYVVIIELVYRRTRLQNRAVLQAGEWESSFPEIVAPSPRQQPRGLPERLAPGSYRTTPNTWVARLLVAAPAMQIESQGYQQQPPA